MRQIHIFDTTLRDGEQSPGCTMNLRDKLMIAEILEDMRVDVIEAGFAISSQGDFESVGEIAKVVKNAAVASLCRCVKADIDRAWDAVRHAARPRLHCFLATSPIHMAAKLKKTPDEVYAQACEMVAYARNLCGDVEFSLEDCSRSERPFMYKVIGGVIRAGAKTVNVPDTVGYAMPFEYAAMMRGIFANVPNIGDALISVHCHNDLGLGVANSLAAIEAGAAQVECTINGIGERAGNAAMEEIVMALKTRAEYFDAHTNIDTTKIYAASRAVSAVTGSKVQANKAVVGENAFAHEAGIHQHGVLANPLTYEIMTPESIGLPRNKMVLGKHSGKHAFADRLNGLGFKFDAEKTEQLFAKFKDLADLKKTVSDADIEALARNETTGFRGRVALEEFNASASSANREVSKVRLRVDGVPREGEGTGDGPLDASFNAICAIIGLSPVPTLENYQLHAVTDGTDAQGEASVRIKSGDFVCHGSGVSTDIIEASILAYIQAVNIVMDGR